MYDLIGNSEDYLAEGVYRLADDSGNGLKQYISSSGSTFSLGDGTEDYLADAQVDIVLNENGTTGFTFDCVDDAGNKITGFITDAVN